QVRRRHRTVLILITFLVYSSASSTVFQTFACDHLDDDLYYLRADYRLRCHHNNGITHDDTSNVVPVHRAYMIYAGLMIAVYPIGIPILYGVLVWSACRRPPHRYHKSMMRDLWKPYKRDRLFYEVVECARRLMLTGAVVFISPGSVAQISTAFLLALLFFAMFEALDPYKSWQDCWMSRFGHLIVLLSMLIALMLGTDSEEEAETGEQMYDVILTVANVLIVMAV
ncbi:unnamed protein product, partial [Sphacelaria rigidula]